MVEAVEAKPWYNLKLPEGKVWQLDTDVDKMYEGLEDIGIGPRYLGEIRKGLWHLELGGPKHKYRGYLCSEMVFDPNDVVDGRVELIGPDVDEIAPETSLPFAVHIRVYGSELNEDHSEFVERGAELALFFAEGWGVVGARDILWLRMSKEVAPRMSFKKISQCMRSTLMAMCPLAEAVEIRWVLATPEIGGAELIEEMLKEVKPKWDALAARHERISDEDVDDFYGCTICKMIAPNHACVVSPSHIPYCGVMTYWAAKAQYDLDPHGYIFSMPRGEAVDAVTGRYTGVDDAIWEHSDHRSKIFHLYSVIKYPTTN